MPTLLQIDTCLEMGSTGRITESIGNLAIKCGWNCYIIHGARYSMKNSCMNSIQSVKCVKYILIYSAIYCLIIKIYLQKKSTKRVI